MPATSPYDAVLLVGFGGPEGPDDVIPFLENVTAGRNIPRERLAVVAEQYDHFGGVSPINDQARRQQSALQAELDRRGLGLHVYWGNRNWHPYLPDTVAEMAEDGVGRALAVLTSAYSSYSGCRQYRENLAAASEAVAAGRPDGSSPVIDKVRAYYDHPGFIEPFARATTEAVARLRSRVDGTHPHLLFTAHSIPDSMASTCDYQAQLAEAVRLVAERVDPDLSPSLVWQSRSGPPQVPWLEPDVNDALEALASDGTDAVVIVPIGFVSDHMEVMWDLDTQARATADHLGVAIERAIAPGTGPDPAFTAMWADLIEERIAAEQAGTDGSASVVRVALGDLPVRPDRCAADCCPAPTRPARRP